MKDVEASRGQLLEQYEKASVFGSVHRKSLSRLVGEYCCLLRLLFSVTVFAVHARSQTAEGRAIRPRFDFPK